MYVCTIYMCLSVGGSFFCFLLCLQQLCILYNNYLHICLPYIYIYRDREREKERREKEKWRQRHFDIFFLLSHISLVGLGQRVDSLRGLEGHTAKLMVLPAVIHCTHTLTYGGRYNTDTYTYRKTCCLCFLILLQLDEFCFLVSVFLLSAAL